MTVRISYGALCLYFEGNCIERERNGIHEVVVHNVTRRPQNPSSLPAFSITSITGHLVFEGVHLEGVGLLTASYASCEDCGLVLRNVTAAARIHGTEFARVTSNLKINVHIEDLTATGYGPAVLQSAGAVSIKNVDWSGPGGFVLLNPASVEIEDVTVRGATQEGILIQNAARASLRNLTVQDSAIGLSAFWTLDFVPAPYEIEGLHAINNGHIGIATARLAVTAAQVRVVENGRAGPMPGDWCPAGGWCSGEDVIAARSSVFVGNLGVAMADPMQASQVDVRDSWWGSPDGPSVAVGRGSEQIEVVGRAGDAVSPTVQFAPWAEAPPANAS